ncbi:MAG TPA: hypothetical protein VE967_09325, partial [Gemmatimonadaceae bacterium]|nr:hypothetical protein [Gemmatimonadaceae bacterium]
GVAQTDRRLAEAAQLGFRTAYVAARSSSARGPGTMAVEGVPDVGALFRALFGARRSSRAPSAART